MKSALFRKMSRERLIALASAAVIFAAGALAYAFVGPLSAQNNAPKPVQLAPPGGTRPLPAMITPSSMSEVQLTFAPVVKKVMPAVVNVYARSVVKSQVNPLFADPFFSQFFGRTPEMRQRVQQGLGSGVIVRPDGIILTNNHVVEGGTDIVVALSDKREFKAKVLTADPHTDLAVLGQGGRLGHFNDVAPGEAGHALCRQLHAERAHHQGPDEGEQQPHGAGEVGIEEGE